jgi:uncharacterized membrane protein
MSSTQAPEFEAYIVPYRSLSRRGVLIVVAMMAVLSATVAVRFWLLGAWPIVVFSLVDVPLIVLLLAINLRRARASELIMLNAQALTVIRTDPAGRRKQLSLPSAWLQVDLHAKRGVPRLMVSSHGRDWEVGAFLHESDKLSLFEALNDALNRMRNPRFHNTQLSEF